MQLRYGSYSFPDNAVQLTRRAVAVRSPQGVPYAEEWRWECTGELIQDGVTACAAAEREMSLALGKPFQDASLYDGSTLIHSLPNRTSLDGVVVEDLSIPFAPHLYATGVPFSFTIVAKYQYAVAAGPVLLTFQERLSVKGGGPRKDWVECVNAPPQPFLVTPKTVCRAVQSGSATSLGGYLGFASPLWPRDEDTDLRETDKSFSRNADGVTEFSTSWAYYFSASGPIAGDPRRGI